LTSKTKTNGPPVVRFAPSPTGHLHLGGLRTALFNHLFARRHGGRWILRIEDTDRNRYVPGAVESMQETLKWAGLEYDEGPDRAGDVGPYLQSQRLDRYKEYIERLLKSEHAYRDFRPPSASHESVNANAKLPESAEGAHVVRLRMPQADTSFEDQVYGSMRIPYDRSRDDPILVKSDGWPTYHLANVVDDTEMGITHVLRGEEWLPSMPIHLALYDALGVSAPKFAHLPLLVNPDGSKLSKRHADVHVESYRRQGFEPEALLNFVALMGYNWHDVEHEHEGRSEVFYMQDMIEGFELPRIAQSRACPDLEKLKHLNRQHISAKVDNIEQGGEAAIMQDLLTAIQKRLSRTDVSFTDAQIDTIRSIFLKRAQTVNDAAGEVSELLKKPDYGDPRAASIWSTFDNEVFKAALVSALESLQALSSPTLDTVDGANKSIKQLAKAFSKSIPKGVAQKSSRPAFFKCLRFALTAKEVSAL
jgi:glutamyl-tRNA synthetase